MKRKFCWLSKTVVKKSFLELKVKKNLRFGKKMMTRFDVSICKKKDNKIC